MTVTDGLPQVPGTGNLACQQRRYAVVNIC